MPIPKPAEFNYGTRMMVFRAARSVMSDFVSNIDAVFPDFWHVKLMELFSQNNLRLSKGINIDLAAVGYPAVFLQAQLVSFSMQRTA